MPEELKYYRVDKHLLICDSQPKSIVVLTVIHASRDIAARLGELLPELTHEVALLHRKLGSRRATPKRPS